MTDKEKAEFRECWNIVKEKTNTPFMKSIIKDANGEAVKRMVAKKRKRNNPLAFTY